MASFIFFTVLHVVLVGILWMRLTAAQSRITGAALVPLVGHIATVANILDLGHSLRSNHHPLDFEEAGWSARAWIPSRRDAILRFHQEFANAGDHVCAV
jgi:hypothetical protein